MTYDVVVSYEEADNNTIRAELRIYENDFNAPGGTKRRVHTESRNIDRNGWAFQDIVHQLTSGGRTAELSDFVYNYCMQIAQREIIRRMNSLSPFLSMAA